MPVIVNKEDVDYYLVPAPLVSFSKQNYSNIGRPGFGADYSVTLQGTLIQTHGNPYYASTGTAALADDTVSWTKTRDVEPEEITAVSGADLLEATIRKQELIRYLFTNPSVSGVAKPLKVTIKGWEDGSNTGSGLSFQAFVDEIAFDADSAWARPTTYTISLRNATFLQSANGNFPENSNENLASGGYAISSLTENFDIQEEGRTTLAFNKNEYTSILQSTSKVYTINRSVSAVGSPVYDNDGGYLSGLAPWQQASGYILEYMGLETGIVPSSLLTSHCFGSGYNIANTVYQESIDREAGSYSLTETYIAYSGEHPVLEQITINHDVGENESNAVSVQGTIQGLNTASGFDSTGNAYLNANAYWTGVASTGIPPEAYYYAKGILTTGDWLHPRPLGRSVASDFSAGTISYTYNFDDRPPNLIPGSISESIQVSDTYPGEIFSVTPVIGRSQPVLQYLNSRSEYKRNLSINVTMGKPTGYLWGTGPGGSIDPSGHIIGNHNNILQSLMLDQKPSISNSFELNYIYQAANPVNDPYFIVVGGKCFHSAPTESWDAKTRNYTYNIEWTYERQ
jgi:hypothetical protein